MGMPRSLPCALDTQIHTSGNTTSTHKIYKPNKFGEEVPLVQTERKNNY